MAFTEGQRVRVLNTNGWDFVSIGDVGTVEESYGRNSTRVRFDEGHPRATDSSGRGWWFRDSHLEAIDAPRGERINERGILRTGDRVRITSYPAVHAILGLEGVVIQTDRETGRLGARIEIDAPGHPNHGRRYWNVREVERVVPTPAISTEQVGPGVEAVRAARPFVVGDTVRILRHQNMGGLAGALGVVRELRGAGNANVTVEITDVSATSQPSRTGRIGSHYEEIDEVELVTTPVPVATPTFTVGQRVRITEYAGRTDHFLVGAEGTIRELRGDVQCGGHTDHWRIDVDNHGVGWGCITGIEPIEPAVTEPVVTSAVIGRTGEVVDAWQSISRGTRVRIVAEGEPYNYGAPNRVTDRLGLTERPYTAPTYMVVPVDDDTAAPQRAMVALDEPVRTARPLVVGDRVRRIGPHYNTTREQGFPRIEFTHECEVGSVGEVTEVQTVDATVSVRWDHRVRGVSRIVRSSLEHEDGTPVPEAVAAGTVAPAPVAAPAAVASPAAPTTPQMVTVARVREVSEEAIRINGPSYGSPVRSLVRSIERGGFRVGTADGRWYPVLDGADEEVARFTTLTDARAYVEAKPVVTEVPFDLVERLVTAVGTERSWCGAMQRTLNQLRPVQDHVNFRQALVTAETDDDEPRATVTVNVNGTAYDVTVGVNRVNGQIDVTHDGAVLDTIYVRDVAPF